MNKYVTSNEQEVLAPWCQYNVYKKYVAYCSPNTLSDSILIRHNFSNDIQ